MRLPMALPAQTTPAPHHCAPNNQYRDGDTSAPMGKGLDSPKNPPPDHLHDVLLNTPTNKSIKTAATSD